MVITVAKNLPKGASETVHIVAFTPTPRLIQLEFVPEGEQKMLIGELGKSATHYVLKPRLGPWLKLFATLLGRAPPDSHAWIVKDELPAFVRFEGPLVTTGPVWRIETTSPRWPDEPKPRFGLDGLFTCHAFGVFIISQTHKPRMP